MDSSALTSFLYTSESETQFPLENIPFGVAIHPVSGGKVCCTRIGDYIINLTQFEAEGLFKGALHTQLKKKVFEEETLNFFASHGKPLRIEVRETLQSYFSTESKVQIESC